MSANSLLEGIRVLDMSRVLAGPWATQLLADYGAEVIKIEKPITGDDTRQWGPPWVSGNKRVDQSDAAYFLAANRNKRSLTCDFSTKEGASIIKELVKSCDVLIENYRTGTLDRYGLGETQLKKINNKLIYCSITAFSETSSKANESGYDAMIQASGGFMSITGEKDGKPQKAGVAIADIMAGMYAVSAVLASLYRREQNEEGQRINVPLFDSQVAWLANQSMNYLVGDQIPTREGSGHPNIVPYQAFSTSDGDMMLAVGNDKQFERLMTCLNENDELFIKRFKKNEQRVDNKDEIINYLQGIFSKNNTIHWLSLLREKGIPCGPINNIHEVFDDSYTKERNIVRNITTKSHEKIPTVANPVTFSNYDIQYNRAPPKLGEHTDEILREILGFSDSDIDQLRVKHVI
mgnify:FL=1